VHINLIRSGSRNQFEKLLLRKSVRRGAHVKKMTVASVTGFPDSDRAELTALLAERRAAKTTALRNDAERRIFEILLRNGVPSWRLMQSSIA
jgi:hypothetical protein